MLSSDLKKGNEQDTSPRLHVSLERNVGWPCLREQKDHAAVGGLVGVTPDQGVEESSTQGKAPQTVQQPSGW
ncbi:MAG: hypothetical protein E6I91_12070 [Chloroflexi bacterium]|nr:MAG: hypothetical protein E6I91_12070 [Chloroflexota bacterium]